MDAQEATRDLDALAFAEAADTVLRVGPAVILGPLLMGASIWRSGEPDAAVGWTAVAVGLTVLAVSVARAGRNHVERAAWRHGLTAAALVTGAAWGSASFLVDSDTPAGAISRVVPVVAVIAILSVILVPHRPSLIAGVAGVLAPYLASFTLVDHTVTVEALPGVGVATAVLVAHAFGQCRLRRAAIVARLAAAEEADEMRRDRAHALATNARLRAVNEQVRRLAEHDALTGAYNRRVLLDRLNRVPVDLRPDHALVLLDLDHFKDANDRYGHATGDEILCHLTAAAHQLLGDAVCFTRWGGEEFAFLLRGHHRVHETLDALRAALLARLPAGVHSTFSAGAARWEHDLLTGDLLRRADAALYAAKANGRSRTEVYSPVTPAPPRGVAPSA